MKIITRNLALVAMLSVSAACSAQEQAAAEPVTHTVILDDSFVAQESAWRTVDPENLLLIDTDYGRIGVELYPEIAPKHVERIKTLARRKFYDGLIFHRVIEDFMNQTGDPEGTGAGSSDLPDLEGEFTFRRATNTMPVTIIDARQIDPRAPSKGEIGVGFYKSLPVATQPAAQAIGTKDGKVAANGIHCKGVTSMARADNPNSGNSQFFLMRGVAQWLDRTYSIWGNTVMGLEFVERFNVGVAGETAGFVPDKMNRVTIASDWPVDVQPVVKVLNTKGADFKRFLDTQKSAAGNFPDICDIVIPSRVENK